MKKFAVFLEPQGELRQEIVFLKNLVDKKMPNQKYCSHPPHCTIIFGAYQKTDLWMDELWSVINPHPPFQLNTKGFQVFYHDQPAGGGHTVVIGIVNAPLLFHIQAEVGNVLSNFKADPQKQDGNFIPEKDPLKTSMERYGFPFVGKHWLPHFSIASLKVRKNSRFLKDMLERPGSFSFIMDEVSIWEIEGEQHTKLHTIHLKGIPTNAAQS